MTTIAAAHVAGTEDLTDASSYVTASVNLVAGRLYFLTVANLKATAGTANAATCTGASQTWVQVASVNSPDSTQRTLTILRCVPSTNQSGALTIAFAGQTQGSIEWSLDSFTGTASGNNGADAIVQTANNTNTSATALTVTLGAFARSKNAVFGALRLGSAGGLVTPEAGWTELHEHDGTDQELETQFLASSDTTASWTWASSSNNNVGIAVEIKNVDADAVSTSLTVAANDAKATVKTTSDTASLTVSAYNATVSYVVPPRTVTISGLDWTQYVMESEFALTECANRGEVGTGGFNIKDLANALDVPALKPVIFDEPAAGALNKRVFTGFTHERTTGYLGDPSVGGVEWGVEVADLNVLWTDFFLSDADSADRPSETDYARMTWLLTTAFGTTGDISAGVVPNSNTVTMEATDYRGRSPADVAAECSEAANKLHFIYDYGAGRKLYYDVATGTSLTATLTISDVDADVDGSTCFGPIGDARVKRSPDRIFSKIHLTYNGGTVSASNATTASNYRTREAAVSDMSISDATFAATKVNALLTAAAAELSEIDALNIVVPVANVNDVRAGQRVQVKLTRQGIDDFTYYRVIRRTIAPLGLTHYAIALGVASDVLPQATGGRGADDIPQNRSNANDDGATVIIDRGGITVTDGAITVTNSGAIVIIDGSSNMFKIAATGTLANTIAANTLNDNVTTTLSALGAWDYTPTALIVHQSATNPILGTWHFPVWGIGSSTPATLDAVAQGYVNLDGSDRAVVHNDLNNSDSDPFTDIIRYYVLQEIAF